MSHLDSVFQVILECVKLTIKMTCELKAVSTQYLPKILYFPLGITYYVEGKSTSYEFTL